MEGLQAIKYRRGQLEVLDQLRLPHEFVYEDVTTCEEAFSCIKSMRVRGAPAIAIVAVLSLAVELHSGKDAHANQKSTIKYIEDRLDYLMGSRPTAVDLSNAIRLLKSIVQKTNSPSSTDVDTVNEAARAKYIEAAEKILEDDYTTNLAIGRYGAEYLRRQQNVITTPEQDLDDLKYYTTSPPNTQGAPDQTYRKLSVLTHCNTGSLATSGHGTALGIIRSLYKMNYLDHAYCTETRPYNQGSRLTAFELIYENIPSTLITDSMAGALFQRLKVEKNISAVIVGADRVARNGDTANKIGTYTLACLAKMHGIKFVVAAPTTSIDLDTASGASIKIEDRAKTELTQISGAVVGKDGKVDVNDSKRVAIADQRIDVWNPSFDVTPFVLIDAIITEKGEVVKDERGHFNFKHVMPTKWAELFGADGTNSHFKSASGRSNALSDDGTLFKMDGIN